MPLKYFIHCIYPDLRICAVPGQEARRNGHWGVDTFLLYSCPKSGQLFTPLPKQGQKSFLFLWPGHVAEEVGHMAWVRETRGSIPSHTWVRDQNEWPWSPKNCLVRPKIKSFLSYHRKWGFWQPLRKNNSGRLQTKQNFLEMTSPIPLICWHIFFPFYFPFWCLVLVVSELASDVVSGYHCSQHREPSTVLRI